MPRAIPGSFELFLYNYSGFLSDMNGKVVFLVRERELQGWEKHLCSYPISELELGIAEREGQPERREIMRLFSVYKQETCSSRAHTPDPRSPVPETGIDIDSGPSLALGLDGRGFCYDIHGAGTSHRTWYDLYNPSVLLPVHMASEH